jgi:beta-lactamase regulating signal transducer with metallopeptidase domain
MIAETCLQGGLTIAFLWAVLRLFPSVSPGVQVWLWRLVFLKLALGLVGMATVSLALLPAEPVVPVEGQTLTFAAVPVAQQVDPWTIAYAVGLAAIAAQMLAAVGRTSSLVRHASAVSDERLNRILDLLLKRSRVDRRPRLLVSPLVSTPLLVGGFRSSIILPASAITNCTTEELGLMMAHEVAHIARKDLLWNLFQSAVTAPLYFHPLVWLAARSAGLARESAADQHALRLTGSKPKVYGEMLLRAAVVARPRLHPEPAGVAMVESYRTVQRRLQTMQHFNRKPSALRLVLTGGLIALTVGLLPIYQVVAKASEPQQPPAPQTIQPAAPPAPPARVATTRPLAPPKVAVTRRTKAQAKRGRTPLVAPLVSAPAPPPVTVRPVPAARTPLAIPPVSRPVAPAKARAQRGVPILQDIPIVGRLFRIEDRSPVEPQTAAVAPVQGRGATGTSTPSAAAPVQGSGRVGSTPTVSPRATSVAIAPAVVQGSARASTPAIVSQGRTLARAGQQTVISGGTLARSQSLTRTAAAGTLAPAQSIRSTVSGGTLAPAQSRSLVTRPATLAPLARTVRVGVKERGVLSTTLRPARSIVSGKVYGIRRPLTTTTTIRSTTLSGLRKPATTLKRKRTTSGG